MAVTDQQKLDFLLKKIGYTKTKTGSVVGTGAISGTPKQPFAEAIPSPLIIANGALWNEADSIPATPPGADTTQVKVYLAATSGLRMTADATSSGQRAYIAYSTYNNTSSTRLTNWIDTQFGASYIIKVYKGDPNSGGVALSAAGSGANDGWFFDYSAGVLNFNDTNVPSGVTDTNIYIVGYRYIGQTGAPTSGISTFSFKDLTVERNLDVGVQGGISTFRNNIDANGDLDVDGHTNLDNLSVAGVSTFAGAIDLNADLDVDGHTNLDNVSIAGVTTFAENAKAVFGNNGELEIFRSGTESAIVETQGNNLNLAGNRVNLLNQNRTEVLIQAIANGTVELYHNNIKRLATTSFGVSIPQDLDVDGHTNLDNVSIAGVVTATTFVGNGDFFDIDVDGHTNLDNVSIAGVTTFADDVTFTTANGNNIVFDKSDNSLQFGDSVAAKFGSGNDLSLFHSGSVGVLRNSQGNFKIEPTPNEKGLVILPNAGVELYYDNIQKLVTTSSGISVTGSIVATGNVTAVDGVFSGNVSIGGTLTYEDVTNVDSVGLLTARSGIRVTGGVIEAQAGENKIPSLYANMAALPSAGTYHGMFAHVHSTGRGYFAHAGNWMELVNKEVNGVVGTGTERYNIGPVDLTTLDVSGISTFAGNVDINADLDVDGHTNLDNVSVAGVSTFSDNVRIVDNKSLLIGDLSNGDLSLVHDGNNSVIRNRTGDLYISNNSQNFFQLTQSTGAVKGFYGGNLKFETESTGVKVTGRLRTTGDLDVDGHTNLDNVSIAGVTTATGLVGFGTDTTYEDYAKIRLGNKVSGGNRVGDFFIGHNPTLYGGVYNELISTNGNILVENRDTGSNKYLYLKSDQVSIRSYTGNESFITCSLNSTVKLYYDNVEKLATTNTGINVTGNVVSDGLVVDGDTDLNGDIDVDGHTNLDNVSIAGVSTFEGSIDANSNIDLAGDLDVNGHTNLDNVSIAGVTTITQDLNVDGHTNLDNVSIVGVTTAAGHVLPSADSTYDLGSSSKYWRHVYADNVTGGGGGVIIGDDIITRNLQVNGISNTRWYCNI